MVSLVWEPKQTNKKESRIHQTHTIKAYNSVDELTLEMKPRKVNVKKTYNISSDLRLHD